MNCRFPALGADATPVHTTDQIQIFLPSCISTIQLRILSDYRPIHICIHRLNLLKVLVNRAINISNNDHWRYIVRSEPSHPQANFSIFSYPGPLISSSCILSSLSNSPIHPSISIYVFLVLSGRQDCY